MPDPRPLIGLYGKVPAHGDFVRRGLPSSFVAPWDSWLAAGIDAARGQLGAQWEGAWDSAPAWRFALPPGACGPDAVAGVMLPSQDQVGRRFPITLAALLAPDAPPPEPDWFDALEAAALAGLEGRADADALAAALPVPGTPIAAHAFALPPIRAALAPRPDDAPAPWPANEAPHAAPDPAHPDDDVLSLLTTPAVPRDAPAQDAPPPGAAQPDRDVLALLASPADAIAAPRHDDPLALLIGAAAPPPEAVPSPDPDGTLAGLIGAGAREAPGHPADPAAMPLQATQWPEDTRSGPIRAPAETAPAPPTATPVRDDGTLAGLIGGAAAPVEDDDVLAGLIGADAPLAAAEDLAPALAGGDAGPAGPEAPDLLAETVPMGWPDLAGAASATEAPALAPPAPEGGGWWTRGGAHVPPMVWPLASLPDPADFAYLLEAAA